MFAAKNLTATLSADANHSVGYLGGNVFSAAIWRRLVGRSAQRARWRNVVAGLYGRFSRRHRLRLMDARARGDGHIARGQFYLPDSDFSDRDFVVLVGRNAFDVGVYGRILGFGRRRAGEHGEKSGVRYTSSTRSTLMQLVNHLISRTHLNETTTLSLRGSEATAAISRT